MKLSTFSLLLCIASLASCGGGSSSTSSSQQQSTSSNQSVTFQSTIDLSNVAAVLKAPAGLTNETVAFNGSDWTDKLLNLLGIGTAQAAASSGEYLYALRTDDTVTWLNLLQAVSSGGVRGSVLLKDQVANANGTKPTIVGMQNTPTFLFLGFLNLYKTNAQGLVIETDENACQILAINKTSGGTFCIKYRPMCAKVVGDVGCPLGGYDYGNAGFQTNSTGTIAYMVTNFDKFVRINLSDSNPNNYTQTELADSELLKRNFVVNEAGEAYFRFKIYLLNGSPIPMNTPNQSPFSCVVAGPTGTSEQNDFIYTYDTTGQIVAEGQMSSGSYVNALNKFRRVTSTNFQNTLIYTDVGVNPGRLGWSFCNAFNTVTTSNNIFTFNGTGLQSDGLAVSNEVKNLTANPPTNIVFNAFTSLTKIFKTDSGFVLWGNNNNVDGIARYNETGGGTISSVLSTDGAYTISKMSVAPNGKVTFSGTRNADRVKVIATIDPTTNVLTIKKSAVAAEVSQIEGLK